MKVSPLEAWNSYVAITVKKECFTEERHETWKEGDTNRKELYQNS